MRNEWGPNANIHWHSMLLSEILSEIFDGWLNELQDKYESIAGKWEILEMPEEADNGFFMNVSEEIIDRFEERFKDEMQEYMREWDARFTKSMVQRNLDYLMKPLRRCKTNMTEIFRTCGENLRIAIRR